MMTQPTLHLLKNDELRCTISTMGAEVVSMYDCQREREVGWNGDAKYWRGHAPLLFPIVGGLWNGECRVEGKTYRIPKHGLVRGRVWQLVGKTENSLTFAIENQPEDVEIFPWKYRLEVEYHLERFRLDVQFRVTNLSEASTMWFQMGGHPSVVCPDWQAEGQRIQGYLRIEGEPSALLRVGDQGCVVPVEVDIPWIAETDEKALAAMGCEAKQLIPICVDTFAHEALIFADLGAEPHSSKGVSAVEVLDLHGRRVARVSSQAPAWLIWSPQGKDCPFVCCEPWYGLCDVQHFEGDFSQRPHVQQVKSLHTWTGGYAVEIGEER